MEEDQTISISGTTKPNRRAAPKDAEKNNEPRKLIDNYIKTSCKTQFFSTSHPTDIEQTLLTYLDLNKYDNKRIQEDKYGFTF